MPYVNHSWKRQPSSGSRTFSWAMFLTSRFIMLCQGRTPHACPHARLVVHIGAMACGCDHSVAFVCLAKEVCVLCICVTVARLVSFFYRQILRHVLTPNLPPAIQHSIVFPLSRLRVVLSSPFSLFLFPFTRQAFQLTYTFRQTQNSSASLCSAEQNDRPQ